MNTDEKIEISAELGAKIVRLLEEYQEKINSMPDTFEIFMNVTESLIIYIVKAGINPENHDAIFIHLLGSLINRFNSNHISPGELQ